MRTNILFVESGSIRLSSVATKELGLEEKFQGRVSVVLDSKPFPDVWVAVKKTGEIHLFLKTVGGCDKHFSVGQEIEISRS